MGCGASTAGKYKETKVVPTAKAGHGESLAPKKIPLRDVYTVSRTALGEGGFGKVSKGAHKTTGAIRAIKNLPKKKTDADAFMRELAVSSELDHPNIVKLFEVYEDVRSYYMVMELCEGGELFDAILDKGTFYESEAASVLKQVLQGVNYMHKKGICHRDLKPENFMLAENCKMEDAIIKIIDFGIACKFEPGQILTESYGTAFYVAPQVLKGKYNQQCDIWATGVLLYILLCGYPPFNGKTESEVLRKVEDGLFSFPDQDWKNVSAEAKTLVRRMLAYSPSDRYTAEAALQDPWIVNKIKQNNAVPLDACHLSSLREFRGHNKLKRVALHAIARRLNEKHIQHLKEVFVSLDKNQDGVLTFNELSAGIKSLDGETANAAVKDLEEVMSVIDTDASATLDYTEFIAATLNRRSFQEESSLWSVFCLFDRDGSGCICKKELEEILTNEDVKDLVDESLVTKILADVDGDADGTISFQEFMDMMRQADDN